MTRVALSLSLLVAAAAPAMAAPAPGEGREVIVLCHAATPDVLRGESVYTATEAALNHLGLVARYWDVADGLPDAGLSARALGVLALLEDAASPDPAALDGWVADRLIQGQPVALLSGLEPLRVGPSGVTAPPEALRPVLDRLGVDEAEAPQDLAVTPGPHAPFEAGWSAWRPGMVLESQDPANEAVWGLKGHPRQAMAFVGPHGALALRMEALREINPLSYRLRWRVDPYWLLGRVFRREGTPMLDATTINGRRIFYAHVDGDGFTNPAVRRGARLASEVVRDEVLARTWLPTTVSVVAKDLVGRPEREAIARTIFALPNVRAASHSFTHPHDWAAGTVTGTGATDGGGSSVHALAAHLTPAHEIDDAARYIQGLLPAGKQVEAIFWSGRTNPPAGYLAHARALGLANLNGGDATLDERHPSVANLAPLARQVGPYVQVYASAANENLFTNLWTGPFDGQLDALRLYRFSAAPRRLSPVNIYYHFYAAERLAGLKALQTLYRWAEAQPLCHLSAADYARVVEGFYAGHVRSEAPGVWSVSDAGACRTLRFDHEARLPDLAASRQVAGWNTADGSLYVHLAAPEARLVMAEHPAVGPHLEEASAPLTGWALAPHRLSAGFAAAAPATVVLAGFEPGAAVTVTGMIGPAHADAAGRLRLTGPAGLRALEVRW